MKSNIKAPFVSVIIPAYNSEKTIGLCLNKLQNQSYPSYLTEIIVVNNNSTDDTQKIIDRFDVVSLFETKKGPSAARNTGIRNAKGEIIIFTDADCLADRDFINQHVIKHQHFKGTQEKFKVIGGGINGQNKNYWSMCDDFLNWHYCTPLLPSREVHSFLPTANLSVVREVLQKNKIFFDERMFPGEDVDFCASFLRKGYKIYFHPKAKISHINRTSLRGVFKHCSSWLRPEFDLRVKKIRSHKPKLKILWFLHFLFIFSQSILCVTFNSLRTKRFSFLLCLPIITIFQIVFHYHLFKIEMKYSKHLKQSFDNSNLVIDG